MLLLQLITRPRTRGDCANVPRPCPFVSCRYHLYFDVGSNGRLHINFPEIEPDEMEESCSLDVADRGPLSGPKAIGRVCGITKQSVIQTESKALWKLAKSAAVRRIAGTMGRNV